MTIAQKLQLKPGQVVVVLGAPPGADLDLPPTDLNRDTLAALLTERGVRPVRQVAIDDVWSALRFRAA